MNPDDDDQFLRLPEVLRLVGLCKSTVYGLEAAGLFPLRRKIGPRAVGWPKREVREWMELRPKVKAKTPKNSDHTPRSSYFLARLWS